MLKAVFGWACTALIEIGAIINSWPYLTYLHPIPFLSIDRAAHPQPTQPTCTLLWSRWPRIWHDYHPYPIERSFEMPLNHFFYPVTSGSFLQWRNWWLGMMEGSEPLLCKCPQGSVPWIDQHNYSTHRRFMRVRTIIASVTPIQARKWLMTALVMHQNLTHILTLIRTTVLMLPRTSLQALLTISIHQVEQQCKLRTKYCHSYCKMNLWTIELSPTVY